MKRQIVQKVNVNKMKDGLTMVILAGGAGRRMGGNKAELIWKGRTFLEHQVEKGRSLGISEILISAGRDKGSFDICGCPVVLDPVWGLGPLGGMEAAFSRVQTKWCLVLGVDIIRISAKELERLISAAEKKKTSAVVLEHRGVLEPLIGMYQSTLAGEIRTFLGDENRSVRQFLNQIGYEKYESSAEESEFLNVNDPKSYQELLLLEE